MIYNNKYHYIIRTSKNTYYRFYTKNQNMLVEEYTLSGTKTHVLKNNVIDYSIDIDNCDRIHILYLSSDGKLKYTIFPYQKDSLLSTVKLNDFSIKFLTLKIVSSTINIFYMLNDKLKSDKWSIYHTYCNNSNWQCKRVDTISAEKYLSPYILDVYNDKLYLFYSNNSSGLYNLKKFNMEFSIWESIEDNISVPNSHNSTFFINNKGHAFLCYSYLSNKSLSTILKSKNLNSAASIWSTDLVINNETKSEIIPSIFCDDNYSYLMWREKNLLFYSKCKYGNYKWNYKEQLYSNSVKTFNGIYLSNHKDDVHFKNTFIFAPLDRIPKPIIKLNNMKRTVDKSTITKTFINEDAFKPFKPEQLSINETLSNELTLKENYIKQLLLLINERNSKLSELNKYNVEFKNKIDNLVKDKKQFQTHIDNYKKQIMNSTKKIESLKAEKISLMDEMNEKHCLLSEADKEVNTMKEQLCTLSEDLNDKDKTIEKLNTLISSLYEENNKKEIEIKTLEEKLNKSFWRIFKS